MTKSRTPKQFLMKEESPAYQVAGTNGKLKFIDLFCGIGGFRYAFERAGGQCVFSSDWNEQAQITYEANHGERPHGDIHTVAVADIPAHDILCAGFPCQPFSIAGVSKENSASAKARLRRTRNRATSSSRWPTSLITTGPQRSYWRT